VRHSFIEGLDPLEAYFHAMGGREGLVDTATKTASVGYIGRKLMRALEDVRVHYDQTVRDAYSIITFNYGGDAIDTTWIETQFYPCVEWTRDDIYKSYDARRHDWSAYPMDAKDRSDLDKQFEREIEAIVEDVLVVRKLKTATQRKELDNEMKAPVHFMRLLRIARSASQERARALARSRLAQGSKYVDHTNQQDWAISPRYVLSEVQHLSQWCTRQVRCESALLQFFCLLRINLSVTNVLVYNELDRQGLDFVTSEVRKRLLRSLAQAGEMVGPIAAQSVAEPTQQMTLNTFHTGKCV
jgi:DNA-directed RNA polymerase II subunit RPB1